MQPVRLVARVFTVLLVAMASPDVGDRAGVPAELRWEGYQSGAKLLQTDAGPRYEVTPLSGPAELLTPDQFATRSLSLARDRHALERLFNASGVAGIAWVAFGLLGQVLFAGRMVVQWITSERSKRSVVPPVFWWMSLTGSAMLLTYFIWRQDIVGILGQSLGFIIYVRNIMLIRNAARSDHVSVPPGAAPA